MLGLPWMVSAQPAKPAANQSPGTPATPGEPPAPTVEASWDSLLQGTIPQIQADPALTQPQLPHAQSATDDFLSHVFFEIKSDYSRYDTSFTGNPTVTGIINAPPSNTFNPAGYPYPPSFQPDGNRVESFLDFGTRGWLSDRVNTHFALRYLQDVEPIGLGSPAQNIVETFNSNRRFEFLAASIEINSKPTDGVWAGTSLTLGRQYVYGAELAPIDGAALTIDHSAWALTLFAGRRFSFFADPDQKAMGGANATWKINPNTSLTYEGIWYIKGSNSLLFRRRLNSRWLVSSKFRLYGQYPVEFSAQGLYNSPNGKTSLHLSFYQQLTNKDYQYDFLDGARDLDAYNPLLRLYLGILSPYSQFVIDARRTISSKLRVGGSVWLRRLSDRNDETPFNTTFEDYRAHAQVFPLRKIETFFEYHQRNSDHLSPVNATYFDDLTGTGVTSVKDVTGEVRRTFGEGRFSLSGGVYYRRVSMQDRFFYLDNLHQAGWLAGAWWKMDQHTRVFFDYNLDNDFFLFRPDLKNSRALHVGVAWKY
jgi:hypothetical protein